MKIISHRRNLVEELLATPTRFGIELDIRSFGAELVVHHEPYVRGVSLDVWMEAFSHSTLILNVKEEGLEARVTEIMRRHNVGDYFFLDQSFPFLIKSANQGERRCAVRVSEYESIATAMSLAGRIDWVWVDCFTKLTLTGEEAAQLQAARLKLCLVSPELQGRNATVEIPKMQQLLHRRGIRIDAVCTKRPDLWDTVTEIEG